MNSTAPSVLSEVSPDEWLTTENLRLNLQGSPEFFTAVERGEVSRDELVSALLERYELSHVFNDILAQLLQCLKGEGVAAEDPLTQTLQKNLDEELGQAGTQYGNFLHSNSRARLVNALGQDYATWTERQGTWKEPGLVSPRSTAFLDGHRQLLAGPVIPAYSAMTYWEWRVSRESQGDYVQFLKAFERLFPELKKAAYRPDDPLWHLHSHSVHDDEHASAFLEALRARESASVVSGFTHASVLWDTYWNF